MNQFQFRDGEWHDTFNDDAVVGVFYYDGQPSCEIILDVCGCIDHVAARKVYNLLSGGRPNTLNPDMTMISIADDDLFAAVVADRAGLIDHGSNTHQSWIEEAGHAWMRLYEEARRHEL
jgi:hypothetical protein